MLKQGWKIFKEMTGQLALAATMVLFCTNALAQVRPPDVTSIAPTSGPTSGGTVVTISGTDLVGATAVTFGNTPANSFSVISASSIIATSPPGAGTVDVTVTTPGGTSPIVPADQFTYVVATPSVTSISPTSGPAAGGTSITISGSNFTGATAVTFGSVAATAFTVTSASSIIATSPSGAGTVDVTVTTPSGTSPIVPSDQFTYVVASPSVTSISPTSGPAAGGTSITISGSNFTGATAVTFGSVAATAFTVNSASSITATSPPGAGTVDVTVTTPGGTSPIVPTDQFTYGVAPPNVTFISPASGPTTGGTSVTIAGSSFTGATGVNFGGTAASSFTVTGASSIVATSPAGAGTVNVTVTTLGGTSPTTPASQFTYVQSGTTIALSSSQNPSSFAQPVTFVAIVTGSSPTGSVLFRDGGVPLGAGVLSAGVATLTSSSLTIGSHVITASYSGDRNNLPSTSAVLVQTIGLPNDSINLRKLQVSVTPLIAQTSGQSIVGAIDSAISAGFADSSRALTPNGGGFTLRIPLGPTAPIAEPGIRPSLARRPGSASTTTMPPNRAGSDRVGSLSNGLHGGNGAPRGTKLVDMSPIPLPPDSGLPPPGEDRFAPNELVLQHAADVTPQQIADLARRLNLTIVAEHTIGILNRRVYTLRIATRQGIREMIRSIRSQGLSVAVQPNYTYRFAQESKDSSGDPAQYAVARLRLVDAHRITRGKDVTVAVIDSAIDTDQPDLAGSVTDRFDAGCGSSPPDAHGTGMAGAIASHKRLLGVAPNTKIIAVCAFSGAGQPASSSIKVLRGLDYAVRRGARIVNMSFAGPRDPALSQALQIARENGVLVIAAVGNSGPKSPPLYPGADRSVLAVTATDQNDGLLPAANQGKYVSLAAPGVNILVPAPNGGLQFTTGTSVAAAHVSGVAALLLSRKPSLTPEEIRKALVATALHLGPAGHNSQYGAGLVDPLKALELIGVRNESSQNDPRQMLAAFNQSSERIENGFSVLGFARDNEKAQPLPSYRPHEWLAWLDVRGGDFSRSTFGSDLRGTQVNAIGGLTYRVTPDFLAGVLGGYERFDYSSQALNGRITGGGWTTGAYLGWRFASNLRVDAAAAWSNILSDAVSGTAAGTFKGSRWLLSGGVTGSYGWQSFVVEPSARLYGLWEHESSYLDSLGVLQRDRNFATGRASGGVKVSAPFDWSTVAAISPYMGLYSDYYFSRDDAIIAGLTGVPILHGWSARATAGITATMRGGAQFAAGAEYGGIGSSSHILSWRMRVWLPF